MKAGTGGQAVVGVVARQHHEIETCSAFHLELRHDGEEIEKVALAGAGQVKVADMREGERAWLGAHARAPARFKASAEAWDAQAGFRKDAKPTQRAIETSAKLPRIRNMVG